MFERLSIRECALRYGISIDTVKRLIKDGTLKASQDNKRQWIIQIDTEEPEQKADMIDRRIKAARPKPSARRILHQTADAQGSIADVHKTYKLMIEKLERKHTDMCELLIERVDSAELRNERLERQIASLQTEFRKPWWQRIF